MTNDPLRDMSESMTKAISHEEQAFRFVGENIHAALGEVAFQVGGESLAKYVQTLESFTPDSILPDPAAVILLEEMKPGSSQLVMDRMREIGREREAAEVAELKNPLSRPNRQAMMRGFGIAFGSWPSARGTSRRY